MGLFSDLLNPVKHVKNAVRGAKALNKGDYSRALNPSKTLIKETGPEGLARQAREKQNAPGPMGPMGMHMGPRGSTTFLGTGTGGRQYTPNPFMQSSPKPPPMAMGGGPPVGMAPPQQVQQGPAPSMTQAVANALRYRGLPR